MIDVLVTCFVPVGYYDCSWAVLRRVLAPFFCQYKDLQIKTCKYALLDNFFFSVRFCQFLIQNLISDLCEYLDNDIAFPE